MSLFDVLLGILALYRLAYLFAKEDGPRGILAALRERGVPDCLYCVSVWLAPVVWLLWLFVPEVVTVIALSGGAVLLHRYTGGDHL